MATLKLKNIDKVYDNGVQAVFDFNLDIEDKEFIVFVGPSGCGKSTTLRMIAGLENITNGELYINGKLMNEVLPKDRDIAMVFQNYALYPHLDVFNNIAFALKHRTNEMPVFEPIADENKLVKYEALLKEKKAVRKQINSLNRYFRKNQNDLSILGEREKLYDNLYEILDKIAACRTQVIGINKCRIKINSDELESLSKELAKDEEKIKLYNPVDQNIIDEKRKAFDLAIEQQLSEEEITKLKNELDDLISENLSYNDIAKSIKNKNIQIEECKKNIEYYQNNQVPVTTIRHLTREEIEVEVNKTAATIDLIRYLYRKPAALSGGQRQRVALGRAIVRKPKAFLMDEPLSNLDAKLRVQTRGEIIKIHKRVGATTIYVTHDQVEAMTMATRIVIMKDGYVQQIGTPEEVFNNPNNLFVAGFIGTPSMNFINATYKKGVLTFVNNGDINKKETVSLKVSEQHKKLLDNHIEEYRKSLFIEQREVSERVSELEKRGEKKTRKNNDELETLRQRLSILTSKLEEFSNSSFLDLVIGIRPENIKIVEKSADKLGYEIEVAELLGHETILYGTIPNGNRIAISCDSKLKYKVGDKIEFNFDLNNAYYFDQLSTNRIR